MLEGKENVGAVSLDTFLSYSSWYLYVPVKMTTYHKTNTVHLCTIQIPNLRRSYLYVNSKV